jgi:hypothetical protein
MSISFGMRVTVPPETLVNVVGNETVILSLKSQAFFGLDEIGTNVWKALTAADSIQAAFDALLKEYDVDQDSLRQDLEDLLQQLIDRGLVEVSSG